MSLSSFFSNFVGQAAASPIKAVGNLLDKLFTSDEERLDKKILLERLAQKPAEAQQEINKIEASHRAVFVAGWRPFIGWVCGIGLFFVVVINPIITAFVRYPIPQVPEKIIFDLIIALLGLGAYRSFEKLNGRTK